ncbi:hypothetical protein Taro_014662, partial [Colocasia esculenta]|nr:hypothetical protein [Colocasia esculenta]
MTIFKKTCFQTHLSFIFMIIHWTNDFCVYFSGTNISSKGSVDTPHTGVGTMLQALSQKMKKWSSSVDTRPSQVDTRGRSQRTMFTGLYNQVDTRCSQIDTRCLSHKACFARLGQGVDTGSSQVDTRDLSQGTVLPVWDSVSTHPMGRSTHSGNFMT